MTIALVVAHTPRSVLEAFMRTIATMTINLTMRAATVSECRTYCPGAPIQNAWTIWDDTPEPDGNLEYRDPDDRDYRIAHNESVRYYWIMFSAGYAARDGGKGYAGCTGCRDCPICTSYRDRAGSNV